MPHPCRTDWPTIVMAVMAGTVAALYVGKVPPALPDIRSTLGISMIEGGWVASIFNLLGLTTGLIFGIAADRLGRRRVLMSGFVSLMAGAALGSLAESLPLLLISRFLEGMGFLAISVTAPSYIFAVARPADRPLALAFWSIFTPLGITLALLMAPWLLAAFGWRGYWLALLSLTFAMMVWAWLRTRQVALTVNPNNKWRSTALETLQVKALWLFAAIFICYVVQWISMMVWLPSFLIEQLAMTAFAAATLSAMIVFANVPGNILGGVLMRKGWPQSKLILISSSIMGLCAVVLFNSDLPLALRGIAAFLFSGFGGMTPGACLAGAGRFAPSQDHVGSANGLLMQGSNLGQFFGPPLIAAVISFAGGDWAAAKWVMVAAALGACLCAVCLRRQEGLS